MHTNGATSLDLLLGHRSNAYICQKQSRAPNCQNRDPEGHDEHDTIYAVAEYPEGHSDTQAVIFVPAPVAPPHMIPFLPSRPSPPSVTTLCSTAMDRQLFLSAFVHGYLPREAHTSPAVMMQSEHWISPNSPAMKFAVEATGLLQLDTVKRSERVQLEGRRRRAAMFYCFQNEVREGKLDATSVLSTLACMMVTDIYLAASSYPTAWTQYVSDIVSIVDAEGPDLLYVGAGKYGVKVARICGLVYALINRKAFQLDTARWLEAYKDVQAGSLDALLNHATRLPALLELVDSCCSVAQPSKSKSQLLESLLSLDKDLSIWLANHYENVGQRHYCCKSDGTSIRFATFLSFNFHSLYWTCQLLLHSAIMHLASAETSSSYAATSRRTADHYANLLRESVDYALSATSGNVIKVAAVRLPLTLLRLYYQKSEQYAKASDCEDLETSVRMSEPALRWDALLPWAYIPLMWLVT